VPNLNENGFIPSRPVADWREEVMRRGRRRLVRRRAFQASSIVGVLAIVAVLVPTLLSGRGPLLQNEVGRPAHKDRAAVTAAPQRPGPVDSLHGGAPSSRTRARIAEEGQNDVASSPSSTRERVAFVSNREGRRQIYLMDIDGSDVHRISDKSGNDFDPAWSPDGKRIAFAHEPGGNNSYDAPGPDSQIWVMDTNGSHRKQLTAPGNDTSCASAYQRAAGYGSGCWDSVPSWSPDGSKVLFTRAGHKAQLAGCPQYEACPSVWTVHADGSGAHRVTSGRDAVWSPDGTEIAFDDAFNADPNCPGCDFGDVYVAQADGARREDLGVRGVAGPWARDSQLLLYTSDSSEIGILTRRGGAWSSHDVTAGIQPSWAPDDRAIAFAGSNDDGLYLINIDGTRRRKITGTSSADTDPVFDPYPV
jgi:Tol biopolymer transport system component